MKIADIANIYQGITLSRIKNHKGETEKCLIYSFVDSEENYIDIPKDENLRAEIPFTKGDIVLLNLTSHRASIIQDGEEGMVIPSTFIVLEPQRYINPYYLEWYLNDDRDFYKNLQIIKQGSIIQTIPIQSFREIKINLPPIKVQEKIGNVSKMIKQSRNLFEEKEKLLKDMLIYINQEGIRYDK
ncbi:restriction endonuclease subunit S [Tissierella pigra]|uniref:restriction endonuclease subunit S n=1 Tax=Tissierella pigra TaxID=2607614 RepID=UPI001C10C7D0|nr:restriction endonuclease subunit S [Tissierella pigra]MBU5428429.1 restriction endonuclease subunit S [Tissierella pigra]